VERTLERPSVPGPAATGGARARAGAPRFELIRKHPAISTAIGLLIVSFLIVIWAGTRPGFDPYGWLVWGHQTVFGKLDTNAAPSWKPLPYLFTVPYAVAGHYELWLWMITSVAVSLSGTIFAGRIAHRLVSDVVTPGASSDDVVRLAPVRRYAPLAAAVFAGLSLLGLRDYAHYVLSAQSDPMIVALCLGAIDCHLSGRRHWAFALGALAGLGRPEVWAFVAVYALWGWFSVRSMRWLIGAGVVIMLALWFGIPALSSRSAFVAGANAFHSGRALHSDKVFGTIDRFLDLHETPLELAALLSVGLALLRRDRRTLVLAAGAAVWVVIEVAFALHGWPGLPRYLYEPAAVMVVVAAVAVGRLLAEPRWFALGTRGSAIAGAWLGLLLVIALAGSLVPTAISRARIERRDLRVQRARTHQIDRLAGVISRAGGAAKIRACGEPLTRLEFQTVVAWQLRVNVARVGFKYGKAISSGRPIVLITPGKSGWTLRGVHQHARGCRGLSAKVA
jgi:hypothetical protein